MSEHPQTDPESPPKPVEIPPNSRIDVRTKWPKKIRNAAMATGATGVGALVYVAVELTPSISHWLESKAEPSSADVAELNSNVAEVNEQLSSLSSDVREGFEQLRIIQTRNIERNNGQDKRLDTAEDEIRRLRDATPRRANGYRRSEGLDR